MTIIGRHNGFTVRSVSRKPWRFEIHDNATRFIVMTTDDINEVMNYLSVTELRTNSKFSGFSYVIGWYRIDLNRDRLAGVMYGRNTQTKSHCEASCRSAYGPYDSGVVYEPIRVNHGVGRYITQADAEAILRAENDREHEQYLAEWAEGLEQGDVGSGGPYG